MPRGIPNPKPETDAVEPAAPANVPGHVWVRVTKVGDGQISTGEYLPGHGNLTYSKGDKFQHPRPLAEQLEERHYVEIED